MDVVTQISYFCVIEPAPVEVDEAHIYLERFRVISAVNGNVYSFGEL